MNSSSSDIIHNIRNQHRSIDAYLNIETVNSKAFTPNPLKLKRHKNDATNVPIHKTYLYNTPAQQYIDQTKNPYDRIVDFNQRVVYCPPYYTTQEVRTDTIKYNNVIKNLGWNK